ncbi:MAG: GNAT family N-acetyltransferase [Proteobacteria bacterium]|nr:GNAT family N-acetyltransferase [Pseudomonadota bacterium]
MRADRLLGWRVSTHTRLQDFTGPAWDACAAPSRNPFVSFAFLSALEDSGCVGGRTGWAPAHQAVRDSDGNVVAVAPTYVKSHSLGEYVFDHGWAEAFARAGGAYYPKIQVAVPFTPATGPRLIVREGIDRPAAIDALTQGLEALRRQLDASSIHATFLPEAEADALAAHSYLIRTDRQFHWDNAGYGAFDDFLAALSSRKRKMIRRERKDALANDITIRWLTGRDITEAHWDAFFTFYMNTGARKWGTPYLNRPFFSLIGERMADALLLVIAERAGKPIAGAINFIGGGTLFGRNWGAIEDHPFLHFEVCYYQAMEFAIARGLARVEAGAQGEHKLLRGYRPVTTFSAHAIAHEGLRAAVARYLKVEREAVREDKIELDRMTPFRRTSDP